MTSICDFLAKLNTLANAEIVNTGTLDIVRKKTFGIQTYKVKVDTMDRKNLTKHIFFVYVGLEKLLWFE